jgi:hypothetical protein
LEDKIGAWHSNELEGFYDADRDHLYPLAPEAARAYRTAHAEEELKMQALVSLWLRELTTGELPSLEQELDEAGQKTQARADS